MALPISLKVNTARPMLRREGFALSKTAKAFRGAIKKVDAESTTGYRYVPADLGEDELLGIPVDDPGIYQFPETGVVQLKPSALRADLMESADWAPFWLGLSSFRYAIVGVDLQPEIFEIPQAHLASQPKVLTIQRDDTANLIGITPTGAHLAALNLNTRFNLIWLAESTMSFHPNEVFSIFVRPFGIVSDRAAANFGFAFGYRWYMQLNMAGGASLYEYSAGHWVRRKQFGFAQGGVDPTQEFQITVIPHQMDGISFMFSQAAQGNPSVAADYRAAVSSGFFYETKKNGFNPAFNSARKMHVKTDAAPLVIAARKDKYQIAFMVHRCRYKPAGMTLAAESLDEPKPIADPTLTAVGYYGQNYGGEPGATIHKSKTDVSLGVGFFNELGAAWDKTKDTKLVASTWLVPSGSSLATAVYSPEIWAMEYEIPAETHTVAGHTVDLSEDWFKLSGRLSVHPDSNILEFRFRRGWDWQFLYKMDGTCDLEVDGYKLHEGEVLHYRPTFDGKIDFYPDDVAIAGDNAGKVRVVPEVYDDAEASDFWDSLNDTSASHFLSFTKRSYGALIEKVLKLRGDVTGDIEIAAELYSLEVDGWEAANDWKTTNENASLGDVCRLLIALYGMQGKGSPRDLRIIRRNGKSKAFLSPAFDPTVTPPHVFYLHSKALPEAIRSKTDEERYAGISGVRYWKAFSSIEITRRRKEYNAVKSFCTVGNADGADMFASFISPHPKCLTDATYWDFDGRVRSRCYGPNENSIASTLNELQKITRRRYDTDARALIGVSIQAEFQPGKIDTDQFALVVMPALTDDGAAEPLFLEGEPVMIGAFRIIEIAWEIELSPPKDPLVAEEFEIPPEDLDRRSVHVAGDPAPYEGGLLESLDVEEEEPAQVEIDPLYGMKDSSARRASWQARYILEYVGTVTSANYAMFSTLIPEYGRPPVEEE